jgi:uncharacterized protein (DUF433 family)
MKPRLYNCAEASALTGLPATAIHKTIDRGLVRPVTAATEAASPRLLSFNHLVYLWLEGHGLSALPMSERRLIAEAISAGSTAGDIPAPSGESLLIRHRAARAHVMAAARLLEKARRMAVTDPQIQRGAPVYRGTRIPISLVAEMLEQGASAAEIAEGYPALNVSQIELAPMFVRAYPQRGRPPLRPWADAPPVRATRSRAARKPYAA